MRILFAHGAGAPSSHPWMRAWAERLATLGRVTAFDYPYMEEGRRRPDRMPALLASHRGALERAAAQGDGPLVLAGKSMGSRVGCHLANEPDVRDVAAILCFGYPLVSPGKKRSVRDQVLLELSVPILFVQGTRDRLCPLEDLQEVRDRMAAPSELHVVETGDHSLRVTQTHLKQTGRTQDDVDEEILASVAGFLQSISRE